jgi:predicted metal-binding membrane protein
VTTLEQTITRDRLLTAAGLAAMTALAWIYLVREASRMNGMASEAQMHIAMGMADMRAWDASAWAGLFVMWAVMMVAMMLPSAAPLIVLVLGVYRRRDTRQARLSAYAFLGGYLLAWTAFSAVAALGQVVLHRVALMSPDMHLGSNAAAGIVLIAAGVYQWLPIKSFCLSQCRSPLGLLSTYWREGVAGGLSMGLRHGAFCIGCCWLLMALLFVVGVMNLFWVALLAALVFVEKLAPKGHAIGRAAGVAMAAWAIYLLAAPAMP